MNGFPVKTEHIGFSRQFGKHVFAVLMGSK